MSNTPLTANLHLNPPTKEPPTSTLSPQIKPPQPSAPTIQGLLNDLDYLKRLLSVKDTTSPGERDFLSFCDDHLLHILEELIPLLRDLSIYKANDPNGCYSTRPSHSHED